MSNKKDYKNNCFSPNWVELQLVALQKPIDNTQAVESQPTVPEKETRLESKQRKDVETLLKELDEIRQNIEKVAEKQQRLANLMRFYSEDFVQ